MARSHPNHKLKRLLAEAGLSGEALARSINLAAAENHRTLQYNRKSVAGWLAGSRPPAPVPALVAETLTRRIGRHVSIQETGLALVPDEPGDVLRTTGGSGRAALATLTAADTGAATRGAFRALPFRLANTPPAWTDAEPRPTPGDWRLGPGDLAALTHSITYYAESIDTYGGAHARTALAAYLATDGAAFLAARTDPRTHAQLLGRLSRLTHLLARMCVDCGQSGAAQQYFNVAAQLAIEAGDRTLYAVTLRAMSAQLCQLGHRGGDLGVAAWSAVPEDAPAPIKAFLKSHLAVVHATAGMRRQSLTALSDAMELHGGRDEQPAAPFSGYPVAALHYQRGHVYQSLGDYDKAANALAASLRHRPGRAHRARALTLAQLGEVLLLDGRVDSACGVTDRLLDNYGRIRCPRTAGRLRGLRTRLLPHVRRPSVRSAISRVDGYSAYQNPPASLAL
ncbi:tetratricopeptide repeat protein [Streptomyces sp. S07_1.15]|uniref:tetratricopeptide repeat protein n=1 Tax=Streptomyces sp. S07_1.15 TaxID=2873925 RepID=UPI001D14077D|nr:tetratricopeptide repeat protein [Streptomyces sp. S07_1.15]MCC3653122.1 tetratricopeptide repeat protein [Streptomyces sp. S07_1.15]